jgi:hypothetical protein
MASPVEVLIGVVANDCDTDNFTPGEADADIFIQGSGSIGLKVSAAISTFITTTLSTSPYNFSSGGGEEGDHIIAWFNALNAVNSFGIYLQEGTDTGYWTINAPAGYTGGFVPLIVDPTTDFTAVAGTWTTTGNPTQLDNVTGAGGRFDISGAIMGNFHNAILDQITIGTGIRVTDGDGTTAGTFGGVTDFDGDTNQYGFWTTALGNPVARGKLIIGPATGNDACKFEDTGVVVTFADAPVAAGFYEIEVVEPGTGLTDVDFHSIFIRAENPTNARWSLTITDTPSFDCDLCTFEGFDVITLEAQSVMDTCKFDNGNSIIQNNALIDGCTFLNANTADGVALITSDNPADIRDCNFTFSDGHAIEIDTAGTYTFQGNIFTGYGTGNDAEIYNNSGGLVTLNITSSGTVVNVRNGTSATTVVNSTVTTTVTTVDAGGVAIASARVLLEANTGGALPAKDTVTITRSGTTASVSHTAHGMANNDQVIIRDADQPEYNGVFTISNVTANAYDYTVSGTPDSPATGTITSTFVVLSGTTNGSGVITASTFNYTADQPVIGTARKSTASPFFKASGITGTIEDTGFSATVTLIADE